MAKKLIKFLNKNESNELQKKNHHPLSRHQLSVR